jgi:hypothetical protein
VVCCAGRGAVQALLWAGAFTREQHVRLESLHEVAMMWSALDVSLLAGLLVMAEIRPLSMCVTVCLYRVQYSLTHLSTAMERSALTACQGRVCESTRSDLLVQASVEVCHGAGVVRWSMWAD